MREEKKSRAMSQESTKPLSEKDIVNPINAALPPAEKADRLCEMSEQNRPLVDEFIKHIDGKYKTKSSSNCKLKERILSKASRPATRKVKEWFDVEHVRDGLRFRTAMEDFTDLPKIIADLKASGIEIVKAETVKMLDPLTWGWRAVMYDLRLPNGQLVEYYLTVKELMDANNNVHHPLYEKWRNCTNAEVTAKMEEYNKDVGISVDAFERALEDYLKRTSQTEETIRAVIAETDSITG
jgi:hypothetical protein